MTLWPSDKYRTIAERDGVKYEIVKAGVGLFGEQLFQACTFGIEMRPRAVRRTLGTFTSEADALECIKSVFGECQVDK